MSTFRRDRQTWTTYGVFALLGFVQSSLGPILPSLRQQFHLSYAVGGLHLSAFAAGALVAGVTIPRIAARIGLRRLLWAATCGMGAGCLLLVAGRSAAATLLATGIVGSSTSWIVGSVQALLSAHHGENRAVALVEIDVAASLGAFVVPLAVAAAAGVGASWRVVLTAAAVLCAGLTIARRRTPFAEPALSHADTATRPSRLRYVLLLVFAAVAVEWSVGFWAATVLHDRAGAGMATAAAGAGAFFGAMLAGRAVAGVLVRRTTPTRLMAGAIVLALAAYPCFWFARTPELAVAGLVLLGLAIAPMFPLAISLGLAHGPDNPVLVVARMEVVGSCAILAAPYTLGRLADATTLFTALAAVPALLLLTAVALGLDGRRAGIAEDVDRRAPAVPAYELSG
jgi:fucose permease